MPVRHTHEWQDELTGRTVRQFSYKASMLALETTVQWVPPLLLVTNGDVIRQMIDRGYARHPLEMHVTAWNAYADQYNEYLAREAAGNSEHLQSLNVDAAQLQALGEGGEQQEPALRDDGPTVAEFVERGYKASNYPPEGYASKSTEAEIAAAIEAEQPKTEEQAPPAPVAQDEPKAEEKTLTARERRILAAQGEQSK